MSDHSVSNRNHRTVSKLLLFAVGMFGFGFALVPLYNVFCEITGFNGFVSNEPAVFEERAGNVDREISIEFVSTVNQSGPWNFRPMQSTMKVKPGELYTAYFVAENRSGRDSSSQIVPSMAPGTASRHFHKTECFCFVEQSFDAAQVREMPVTFYVDPALPDHTKTITLSYTLFDLGAGDVPEFDADAINLHSNAR